MKVQRVLVRAAFPLMIGLGLIAVALWLFGALPVRGATSSTPIDVSEVVSSPPFPLQAQNVITIPRGTSIKVDSRCDLATKYSDAAHYDFTDVDQSGQLVSGTVYLKHDDTYLYVCMDGSVGGFLDRFARVYLDTTNDREQYAGENDFAFQVGIVTPTLVSSYKGTGVPNGYVPINLTGWSAAAQYGNGDEAEYAIPLNLTGGWCGAHFGMAVYHHWVNLGSGDDHGWPSAQWFDQPHTWQEVYLRSSPVRQRQDRLRVQARHGHGGRFQGLAGKRELYRATDPVDRRDQHRL